VSEISNPRRIVTALGPDGLSYLASVDELTPSDPSRWASRANEVQVGYPRWAEGDVPLSRTVWGCDELPFVLPSDPAMIPHGEHMPPGGGGFRVSLMTYPSGWKGEMFWSNRVDLIWILSGELTYLTDGGDEIALRPGDVVIQNGTNKAFENRGQVPVSFGAICCSAVRVGPTPPADQFHGSQETLRQHLDVGRSRA
jgi:hypothetical protein